MRPRSSPLIERHPGRRFWQCATALLGVVTVVLLGLLVGGK